MPSRTTRGRVLPSQRGVMGRAERSVTVAGPLPLNRSTTPGLRRRSQVVADDDPGLVDHLAERGLRDARARIRCHAQDCCGMSRHSRGLAARDPSRASPQAHGPALESAAAVRAHAAKAPLHAVGAEGTLDTQIRASAELRRGESGRRGRRWRSLSPCWKPPRGSDRSVAMRESELPRHARLTRHVLRPTSLRGSVCACVRRRDGPASDALAN